MKIDNIEILLVEDNKTDAELTIRVFRKNNLVNKVLWVKDGEEALNFVFGEGEYKNSNLNHSLRVILLDLRLPKIDGFEVLKEIRSNEQTKNIPIIVLTYFQNDIDFLKSEKLEVNGFIGKPVEFESFVHVLAKIGFSWVLINKFSDLTGRS